MTWNADDNVMPEPAIVPKPLKGGIPEVIRRDLQYLRRVIDISSHQRADAPVPIESVREILITGVTGFFAPFLLTELLQKSQNLVANCIVRADNDTHAISRIQKKLKTYNLWDDSFSGRINAIAGDITKPNFGIESIQFRELSTNVHAVYHCAASVSLGHSYEGIRKTNVFALQQILDLCMRVRLKHLFMASTLGIFPEYQCLFREEFSNHYIKHEGQPNLDELMGIAPPELSGYPWSKIVVEQLLLHAKSHGVPIGIFRLPVMVYTEVGVSNPHLIGVRISAASNDLQMRVRSKFPPPLSLDPADRIAKIMAAISLNPARRHTIYNCCNREPRIPDFLYATLHRYAEVSYEDFRAACVSRGEESPLFGQLPILDLFYKYWFGATSEANGIPVDNRSMIEDCPDNIEWLGGLVLLARSRKWQEDNRDLWPYPLSTAPLDYDGLISYGQWIADQLGVPFEDSNPPWMIDALTELVSIHNANHGGQDTGKRAAQGLIHRFSRGFRIRAELHLERKHYPEIALEQIERPVFIVGLNRTGTTFLHRILASDPQFWTLKLYQLIEPSLPDGMFGHEDQLHEELRLSKAEDIFLVTDENDGRIKEYQHLTDLDMPEEEGPLFNICHLDWALVALIPGRKCSQFLQSADFGNAYDFHHSVLKNFSYRWRQKGPSGRWLLKYPLHLHQLEDLIKEYPDASFIMPHRPLNKVVGSFCSIIETLRKPQELQQPKSEVGSESLRFLSKMANQAIKFRESHPELEHRWVDVSFFDLIEDPYGVIEAIYDHLDCSFSQETKSRMDTYMAATKERLRARKKHRYDIADYNLSPEDIDEAFAPYLGFLRRHRIMGSNSEEQS